MPRRSAPPIGKVRSKRKAEFGPLQFPLLAKRATGANALAYTRSYLAKRTWAPFLSLRARDWDLVIDTPLKVRAQPPTRSNLAAQVETRIGDLAQYVSTFLTHPRYGPQQEVGFARGDTLRAVNLRSVGRNFYEFRAQGLAVGREDLARWVSGRSKDKQTEPAPSLVTKAGWTTFTINMPENPEGRGVTLDEWYDFTPSKWRRKHPQIGLVGLSARIQPKKERFVIEPDYRRLYQTGTLVIGLLFGYDFEYAGHGFASDARRIGKILTAPSTRRFTSKDSNIFGYHGPGLGFQPVDAGSVKAAPGRPLVFRRSSIPVQVPGSRSKRKIDTEIRLYNFDKSSRLPGRKLIEQFVAPFRDCQVIHYDGHANYGGGFYVGATSADELWATDIGGYQKSFSTGYQIFSIGACHSAGYFADLFYNELKPRKTPDNLHIIASVNEQAYADAVHTAVDLVANLLQVDEPHRGVALSYEQLLMELNYPSSSSAYIGVFGRPTSRRR